MTNLNESIVEDVALTWFGEFGYAIAHGPHIAPGEQAGGTLTPTLSQRERESYSEEARATHKKYLSVENTAKGG